MQFLLLSCFLDTCEFLTLNDNPNFLSKKSCPIQRLKIPIIVLKKLALNKSLYKGYREIICLECAFKLFIHCFDQNLKHLYFISFYSSFQISNLFVEQNYFHCQYWKMKIKHIILRTIIILYKIFHPTLSLTKSQFW